LLLKVVTIIILFWLKIFVKLLLYFINKAQFFIISCFYIYMNGVENTLAVNTPKMHVGILAPPNELHKPVLYSHKEGSQKSRALLHDMYEKEKENTIENQKKTPLSVKVSLVLAALTGGWITFRKVLKW